jgi:hypothetical protein
VGSCCASCTLVCWSGPSGHGLDSSPLWVARAVEGAALLVCGSCTVSVRGFFGVACVLAGSAARPAPSGPSLLSWQGCLQTVTCEEACTSVAFCCFLCKALVVEYVCDFDQGLHCGPV